MGQKIYLSPISVKDVSKEYVGWFNDPEVCRYNSHGGARNTRQKTLAYVKSVEKSKTAFVFTIRWKDNAAHIGNVSLQAIDRINRSAEIAIIIGAKDYWGRGVGLEAYQLLLKYGFHDLGLNRISSGQSVKNTAMIKVCQKVGMKKEALLRQAFYKNGIYSDIVIYSILKKEFHKRITL